MILMRFVTSAYSTQTLWMMLKFKRYEDASLSYTGIDKNADKAVGGWDTVLRREEYERLFKYVWTNFWSYPLSLIL